MIPVARISIPHKDYLRWHTGSLWTESFPRLSALFSCALDRDMGYPGDRYFLPPCCWLRVFLFPSIQSDLSDLPVEWQMTGHRPKRLSWTDTIPWSEWAPSARLNWSVNLGLVKIKSQKIFRAYLGSLWIPLGGRGGLTAPTPKKRMRMDSFFTTWM